MIILGTNDYDPTLLDPGTELRTYWNVTRSCWSVLTRTPKGWRLAGYTRGPMHLDDVAFVVREAGRKRVLAEGRKNVHAYVQGTLLDTDTLVGTPLTITYNPYKDTTFVSLAEGKRWPLPTGRATVRLASYTDIRRVGPSVLATWR